LIKIIPKDDMEYSRYLLGRVRFFMTRARQYELTPYHISPRQAYILFLLYTMGSGMTLRELAWQTDRKINTLSVNMSKMERDGLVKKIRDTPNSIQFSFTLTEKGLNTYQNCMREDSIKAIMSVLSKAELKQFISMLENITAKAEKYKIRNIN
jgi:DNA-binding MarR family transcriptional regulator